MDQVRSKTFKITLKAAQYEAALNPEVWPYRVAVHHYKAPRRQGTTWSEQSHRAGYSFTLIFWTAGPRPGIMTISITRYASFPTTLQDLVTLINIF